MRCDPCARQWYPSAFASWPICASERGALINSWTVTRSYRTFLLLSLSRWSRKHDHEVELIVAIRRALLLRLLPLLRGFFLSLCGCGLGPKMPAHSEDALVALLALKSSKGVESETFFIN